LGSVPHVVTSAKWKNFCHNRTIALQQAQEIIIQGWKLNPYSVYLLFLDADMVIMETEDQVSAGNFGCFNRSFHSLFHRSLTAKLWTNPLMKSFNAMGSGTTFVHDSLAS
jgi:hypothetical protein